MIPLESKREFTRVFVQVALYPVGMIVGARSMNAGRDLCFTMQYGMDDSDNLLRCTVPVSKFMCVFHLETVPDSLRFSTV